MAPSPLSKFYTELKRRKVIRVAIVYTVVAWLLVEVASVLFPGLLLPDWSVRLVIGLAIIGFPIALVLAWAVGHSNQVIAAREIKQMRLRPAATQPPCIRSLRGSLYGVSALYKIC